MRGPDSFERLFEDHGQAIYGFLLYRVGNPTLAEDLLSETFERVLRAHRRFDPRKGSERRWIYAIALNLIRDHARKRGVEERALEQVGAGVAGEGGGELSEVEDRDELSRALATLSDPEREAIALRYGADLKLGDVARVLGEGESAVEARIYRALAKLREQLG